MQARARRLRPLRKIDIRIPILLERGVGRDTPLFDSLDLTVLRGIDGHSNVHALAVATGRTDEEIARSLEKLELRSVVALVHPGKTVPASPEARLKSGMRPALKTYPSDPAAPIANAANAADDRAASVLEELGDEDVVVDEVIGGSSLVEPDDPDARLTVPGLGPLPRDGAP